MIATFKKIMHNMNYCVIIVVCAKEIIYMFKVCQMSGFVENFNMGIFSDTVNVINVKLCMMVLHIELYPSYHFQ